MFLQRFLKFFIILVIIIFLGTAISPAVIAAPIKFKTQFDNSLQKTGGGAGYTPIGLNQAEKTLTTKIGKYIQAALSFLGVLFLILMIYGGYVWMKARGNESEVTRAKEILTNAGIGLVIVILAYAISYFVISALANGALASTFSPTF
ncbi:MAG: hypothetical protein NTW06_01050 [Candidatus Falkowbacteria bacterium]|nr:hypothetical protein [Candidatus Falkowbacteria bacterium]